MKKTSPPPAPHSAAFPLPPAAGSVARTSAGSAPKSSAPALPPGEYAALIGWDWGDENHALALCARDRSQVETVTLPAAPEELHGWLDRLAERFQGQPVAVAVEASKGAIVAALREHSWIVLYPIHPATSRRFSQAFTPSGAADDTPDAKILLDLLRHHRERLRAAVPEDDLTRRVALLVEQRRKLVDQRTQLGNQLTSTLKDYFPQALSLFGERIHAPLALAFLQRWPQLHLLQKARPETIRRFYYANQVRRPELVEQRLAQIATARALTTDRVLCETSAAYALALVAQLRSLQLQIDKADAAVAAAFAAHPDAAQFRSLPGAGPALAPRLCVLFGRDRARWADAAEMQQYYGIAPVIEKSGKERWVHWRRHAPVFGRQTLVEWAGQSVRYCAWARAYYDHQKARQKGHSTILRGLAFKWLRVLWRCWQDGRPYDDQAYLQQLKLHHPPYLACLPGTPENNPEKPLRG